LKFDVLVIGGGVAGVEAAITAKKAKPTASVAMISHNPMTYPRPDPIAVISGYIKSAKDVQRYGFKDLRDLKIKTFEGYRAESLEHEKRTVKITKTSSKAQLSVEYEKLVFSTGSTPATLPLEGSNLKGVFTVKWLDEALALSRYVASAKKAHIIGGGIIGLETAEALARRGLKVTVIEALPEILGALLEPDLAKVVNRHLKSRGIKLKTNTTLEGISGEKKVKGVIIKDKKVKTDLLVCTIGMRPNTILANQIGLQLSGNKAIKTDKRMKTSFEGVYAAGDCAETIDLITGKPVYRPLANIAAQAAKIAGSNAVGVDKTYNGFMRTQYNRVFGVEMGGAGLTVTEAKNMGLTVGSVDVYLKGPKPPLLSLLLLPTKTRMKAIFRKDNEVIVGWQLVAFRKNAWNFWATWSFLKSIQIGRTLSQMQELGFGIQ
jgi:NADPH-dependent 2,4-dienoyl-CoA reductase/sulfur reductase-like enzyme